MPTTELLPARPGSATRPSGRRWLAASTAVVVALVVLATGCVNNGTWTATALNTVPTAGVTVTDVSCSEIYECVAVGSSGFVEVWDGTSWSLGTRPPAADGWGRIEKIDCGAPDRCLAVVDDESGPVAHPHLLAWDGFDWTDFLGHALDVTSSPTPFSCPTRDSCLVVDPFAEQTLVWTYETVTTTPFGRRPPPIGLLGCGAAVDCLMVSADGSDLASWNGTLWSEHNVAAAWQPEAIDCPGSTAETCMAIGHDTAGTASIGGYWTGTGWTFSTNPVDATTWSDVACSAGKQCFGLGVGPSGPVRASFATDTWYGMTVPPSGADAEYGAISCAGVRWCMAVGQDLTPTHQLLASTYTYTMP